MKKRNLILLPLALLTLIWIGCSSSESDTADSGAAQTASPAKTLADRPSDQPFAHPAGLVSAVDLDGNAHQLSEWIGQQPVVINFWGTWCPPCRREIPGLIQLYDEYRERGVEIVSLAIEKRAGPAQVRQFTEQAGMQWVQLMANERALGVFGYSGSVPTTVFLDKDGREIARHVGGRPYDVFKPDFEKIALGS